jgi:hypothetical protein
MCAARLQYELLSITGACAHDCLPLVEDEHRADQPAHPTRNGSMTAATRDG